MDPAAAVPPPEEKKDAINVKVKGNVLTILSLNSPYNHDG